MTILSAEYGSPAKHKPWHTARWWLGHGGCSMKAADVDILLSPMWECRSALHAICL